MHEDWPDFFPLVQAFVRSSGSPRLGKLARQSPLSDGGGDGPVTGADCAFLVALMAETSERLSETKGQ